MMASLVPELWKTDGTEQGTVLVKDIDTVLSYGSYPAISLISTARCISRLLISTNGGELWKSDGTEAGTVLVKDIYPGTYMFARNHLSEFVVPGALKVADGTLYFDAYDNDNGDEFWKTDGSEAGTVLVKDIYPGTYYDACANSSYPILFGSD